MDSLQFGVAVRDITPSYPVFLHGYANRNQRSNGVSEPISLSCLALDDGEQQILLVTCDMVGIESQPCAELYELLKEKTGIAYPHILFSCSHTHFAPALHHDGFPFPDLGLVAPDPRFVEDFKTHLVEAAQESIKNKRPGTLEIARLRAPQVLFNRRTVAADGQVVTNYRYPLDAENYTFSPVDDELTALRFKDENGIGAVLVNFGCHPVTGGRDVERDHYKISADYPFYLRQAIAAEYACPVLFTLGAAGDAVPLERFGDSRQHIGTILGKTVTMAERVFAAQENPKIAADFLEFEAHTHIGLDAAAVEAEYTQARAAFAAAQEGEIAVDREGRPDSTAGEIFGEKLLNLKRAKLYPNNKFQVKVQFLRIGGTTLVVIPFEVLSDIGLRLKQRFPNSAVVSCANGYQGYLPLAHNYDKGGYETMGRSTHFEKGTADRLLEAALDHLSSFDPT